MVAGHAVDEEGGSRAHALHRTTGGYLVNRGQAHAAAAHQLGFIHFQKERPVLTVLAPPDATLAALAGAKAAAGVTVSVCIPARDEADTIAGVVAAVVGLIGGAHPLVDEVVVADDGSVDGTGARAAALGASVVRCGGPAGKGAAMAEAARAAHGDIVVFLDADVRNFGPHFVTGLLRPMLSEDGVVLVKGAYRRPGDGGPAEGGRVTELLARPLLRRLFPELAFVLQPLAGEVAVRRAVLDGLHLEPGYGVEIGMLIDVARTHGPGSIAQVDLGERVHRNRPLAQLTGQADEVLAAVLNRSG